MPELRIAPFTGTVLWLGRTVAAEDILRAEPCQGIHLGLDGISGDVHQGTTRSSCSRVTMLYPLETTIRNTRQITILSREELDIIAAAMSMDTVAPELLGANMVLDGIPDLTHLPPSSRLQTASGTTLVIDRINLPCNIPARAIEKAHPGKGKSFKASAKGRRGVTAWVEREGTIALGDELRLYVPDQRSWAPGHH
ncbi:MAG: MOSC domain-containing protein [Rhodobacteraceae bacterium]|nr:MOSC domain-containing protein [Paracoccaceae bacterium]